MNELSHAQEMQIREALEQMVDLSNSGMSPNDSLFKVATERSIAPEFVKRIGEAFNNSLLLHHFRTSPPEKRADAFPLAVPAEVLDRMYPKDTAESTKQAALQTSSTWFAAPPDFCAPAVEKSAAIFDDIDAPKTPQSIDILFKRASQHTEALRRTAEVAKQDEQYLREMVNRAVIKAAQHFCEFEHAPFATVETDMLTQYGELARPLMNAVYISCRGEQQQEKRGEASESQRVFDPAQEPYNCLTEAIKFASQWHTAALEAEAARKEYEQFKAAIDARVTKIANLGKPRPKYLLDDLTKAAALLPAIASTTFIGDKLNEALDAKESPQEFERAVQQAVDPEQDAELRAAQTKAMLNDFMTNDPVISTYPPEKVLAAFSELSRMTPRVAGQPAMLRGLLSRALEMGRTEPFEASQVINAESDLKKLEEPTRVLSQY